LPKQHLPPVSVLLDDVIIVPLPEPILPLPEPIPVRVAPPVNVAETNDKII